MRSWATNRRRRPTRRNPMIKKIKIKRPKRTRRRRLIALNLRKTPRTAIRSWATNRRRRPTRRNPMIKKIKIKRPKRLNGLRQRMKELQEEKELSQLPKPECDEIRQSAMRQVEEKDRELVSALHAYTEKSKRECARLKRLLEEDKKLLRKLVLEKDDEVQLAKRQIEELDEELAHAQKDAGLARKDADATENKWTKVKREVKEKEKLIKLLKLETQGIRQVTVIQVEEISQELEEAKNEAEHARNEAEHARNDADVAENKWIKAKKDMQEKLELIQMLKLECQETKERAMRQVEEKELELADTLNAVITSASSSSSVAQDCAICLTNEKDMAFGCGHMTCEECGKMLSTCPICREHITIRIKLFHG